MIHTSRHNSARRVVFSALIAVFVLMLTAPVSHAETYTYWSLWEGQKGNWTASQTGASDIKLGDESVIAAKYVKAEETLTPADAPTQSASYKKLCPNAKAPGTDAVNVAIVVEYGSAASTSSNASIPQPSVSCVAVTKPATGATALSQIASVSAQSDGFITAINGYPSTETASPAEGNNSATDDSEGVQLVWWVWTIAIFVLIIVVAIVMIRRRGRTSE